MRCGKNSDGPVGRLDAQSNSIKAVAPVVVPYPEQVTTIERIVIVQARMGSSRFPGKVLETVNGHPLINSVLDRALAIPGTSQVFLATTINRVDNPLANKVALDYPDSVTVARGQEDDVRSRFVAIAKAFPGSIIARVTADDPFKDPMLYDAAFEHLEDSNSVYVSLEPDSVPLGLDVEVFRASALLQSETTSTNQEAREHVTLPLKTGPRFPHSFLQVNNPLRIFGRLTVDYPEDLVLCNSIAGIIKQLGGGFDYATTLAALNEHVLRSGAVKEARN